MRHSYRRLGNVNNDVEAIRSLITANVEEFTDDFIYDDKRDTMLVTIDEVYSREIRSRFFRMEYELVLKAYDKDTDKVTLCFTRFA